MIKSLNRSDSINVKYLMENLMEEIEPVVTDVYEVECRDKSILVARFGKLFLLGFRCKDGNKSKCIQKFFHVPRVFH